LINSERPNAIKSVTSNGISVLWIDDDMTPYDLKGDTDNDCLLIDRNKRYKKIQELKADFTWYRLCGV